MAFRDGRRYSVAFRRLPFVTPNEKTDAPDSCLNCCLSSSSEQRPGDQKSRQTMTAVERTGNLARSLPLARDERHTARRRGPHRFEALHAAIRTMRRPGSSASDGTDADSTNCPRGAMHAIVMSGVGMRFVFNRAVPGVRIRRRALPRRHGRNRHAAETRPQGDAPVRRRVVTRPHRQMNPGLRSGLLAKRGETRQGERALNYQTLSRLGVAAAEGVRDWQA